MSKSWIVTLETDESGELILPLSDEMLEGTGIGVGDTIEWIDNKDGSWTIQKKEEMEWVMVETVSQFRMRYMVQVPKGKAEWALDTVTMQEAKEFFMRVANHCIQNRIEVENIHHQFRAVLLESIPNGADVVEEFFIKWFWVEVLDKHLMIGHDVAFNTVLVKKRKYYDQATKFAGHETLPLGGFFRKRWSRAKYAQAKQQKQAYKTMGNLIAKKD